LTAIGAAYIHLKNMDKTRFTIEDFLVKFQAIVDEVC